MRVDDLWVPRAGGTDSCQTDAVDMCPSAAADFTSYSLALSSVGLFASPAGEWACADNDFCGIQFWQGGGACARLNCTARKAADAKFCSKRYNGCSKTCGCDRGGAASKVSVLVPERTASSNFTALVLWLHGYTGEASWARQMWKLDRMVDTHSVIVAAPNGVVDDMGFPHWDAGSSFHGIYRRQTRAGLAAGAAAGGGGGGGGGVGNQSKSFLRALSIGYNRSANRDEVHLLNVLDALQRRYGVDASRTWLAGSANGGVMAYHMACRHAHRFAGVLVHGGVTDVGARRKPGRGGRCTVPPRRAAAPAAGPQRQEGRRAAHIQCGADAFDRFAAPELEVWADYFACNETRFGGAAARTMRGVWHADAYLAEVREQRECMPGGSVTLWTLPGAPHFPLFSDAFPALLADFLAGKAGSRRPTGGEGAPDGGGLRRTRAAARGGGRAAGTALLAAPDPDLSTDKSDAMRILF